MEEHGAATPDRPESPQLHERTLDEVLRPRRTRRQRWLTGSVVVALLLGVAIVIGGLGPLGTVWTTLRATVAPSPQPVSPATLLYLEADTPGITVAVDGKPVDPPRIGVDAPLRLSPGQHTLTWRAVPFEPQQCRLWVPSNPPRETCAFAPQPATVLHTSTEVRVALLPENLTTLDATLQTRLLATLRNSLPTASDTAYAGEQYLSSVTGRTTLSTDRRAALHFTLAVAATSDPNAACQIELQIAYNVRCTLNGLDCTVLCAVPQPMRPAAPGGAWKVFGLVRLSEQYTDLPGGQAPMLREPIDVGGAAIVEHLLAFAVRYVPATQQWQAAPLLGPHAPTVRLDSIPIQDDPACAAAQDTIFGDAGGDLPFAALRFTSGLNPSQGCALRVTPIERAAPLQEYLMRFGVIVPVNAAARAALPNIPPASVRASQLAAALERDYPGYTVNLHPRSTGSTSQP